MGDANNRIVTLLKERTGYKMQSRNCGNCKHYREDVSTDNFGSGGQCTRNPDIPFSTPKDAACIGWTE